MLRARARGEIALPALPSLVDEYAARLVRIFVDAGREVPASDRASLRAALAAAVVEARRASVHANVFVRYETDALRGMTWVVSVEPRHLDETYDAWAGDQEGTLFGKHPDAKVMDVARTMERSAGVACLDVGAGDGRNAVPLAELGFSVDAVEPSRALADALEARNHPRIRVLRSDVLDAALALEDARYALVVVSELASHLAGPAELAQLLARLARATRSGGAIVVNLFLAQDGYTPDALARELSPLVWSTLFTREDLARSIAGLPLAIESEESAAEYERRGPHWPPTRWYERWACGQDLFPPDDEGFGKMELRWVVLRRR